MHDPSNPPRDHQFLELPVEMQEQILAQMDLAGLVRMAQTSHLLRDMALATIFTRRGTDAELFQLDWLMNYLYQNSETLSPEASYKLRMNMIGNHNEVVSETLKTLYEIFIERFDNREVNDARPKAIPTPSRYRYRDYQNLILILETIMHLPEAARPIMLTRFMETDGPINFKENPLNFYTLIILQRYLTQKQKDELIRHAADILGEDTDLEERPQTEFLKILYSMRHNPVWKKILQNTPLDVAVHLIEEATEFEYLELDPKLRLKLITQIIRAHMHSLNPKDFIQRCLLIGTWLEQGLDKITNPGLAENVRFVTEMLNFGDKDTQIGPLLAPVLEVYLATLGVGEIKKAQLQIIGQIYQALIKHLNQVIHAQKLLDPTTEEAKANALLVTQTERKAADLLATVQQHTAMQRRDLADDFHNKEILPLLAELSKLKSPKKCLIDQPVLNATLPLTIIIRAILPLLSDADVDRLLTTLPSYFRTALPGYFQYRHIEKTNSDTEVRSPAHGAWLQITAEPRFQNFIMQQIAAAKLEDLETQLVAAEALADASVNEPSNQELAPELEAARNNAFAALETARAEISAMVTNYLTMLECSLRRADQGANQQIPADDAFRFLVIYQEQLKSMIHFFHHYFMNHRYDKTNLTLFINMLLNCDSNFRSAFYELITEDFGRLSILRKLDFPEAIIVLHEQIRALLNDLVEIAKETLPSTEVDALIAQLQNDQSNRAVHPDLKKSLGGAEVMALWEGHNFTREFNNETDDLLGLNIHYLIENVFPHLDSDTRTQFINLIKGMSNDNLKRLIGYLNLSIHGYTNDAELRAVLPQLTLFAGLEEGDFPSLANIDIVMNSLERLLTQGRNLETESPVYAAMRRVVDTLILPRAQDNQLHLEEILSLSDVKFSGDTAYWYQDQDMNDLLMAAVGDRANVVAPLHPFETTYLRENRARFQEYLVDAIRNPERNTLPTVIPINVTDEAHSAGDGMIGRHWVGMMVQYDQATNQVNITLVDPRGNGLDQDITYDPDDINPANYLTQLAGLAHHTIQNNLGTNVRININIPHQRQQTNDHDCGPWTVANLTNLVAGLPLETNPAAVRAIRRRQGGIAEPQAAAEEANGRQKRRETSPISELSHFSDRSAKRPKKDEAAEASDDENQAKRDRPEDDHSPRKRRK